MTFLCDNLPLSLCIKLANQAAEEGGKLPILILFLLPDLVGAIIVVNNHYEYSKKMMRNTENPKLDFGVIMTSTQKSINILCHQQVYFPKLVILNYMLSFPQPITLKKHLFSWYHIHHQASVSRDHHSVFERRLTFSMASVAKSQRRDR